MRHALAFALAVIFCLRPAHAKPREHLAIFDGGAPSIVSPTGDDGIQAKDAICLEFWVGIDPTVTNEPATAVELIAADARFTVKIAADRKSILLSNGAANGKDVSVAVDLTASQMVHLGFNFPPSGATVFVDGLALAGVAGPAFNPTDGEEPTQLRLGGPGFKGAIGAARLWSAGMDDAKMVASRNDSDDLIPAGGLPVDNFVVGQIDGGAIARPAVPAMGLWHEDGAGASVPVLKTLAGIPDVNHGQFADDELFVSIFPSDKPFAEFGFTTSKVYDAPWYLKRGVAFGSYIIRDQGGSDFGTVTFRPSGKAFAVAGVRTLGNQTPPLRVGAVYKTLEIPGDGVQTQEYGEAWQVNDKPKNFEHSVMGCYSGVRMNMFDFQEHGCVRRFFREPSAFSHRFDTGRNNLTIPWGWKYVNFSESRAHGFSDMATSSSEIGNAASGGNGYDFSLAGVTYQNNRTVESERSSIRETKAMRAYHQFVARRHSIVVDAKKIMLDQCFLRDVARLTFAVAGDVPQMPDYFDATDTAGGECDALLDDPLQVDDFIGRYGDLYAYAITYGARAVQRVDMSVNSVGSMSSKGVNVSSGLDYHISGTISPPGTGVGANFKLGGGVTSQDKANDWTKVQNEAQLSFDDLLCVGGTSCSNGLVEVGDNPVPIYLDLRPMTDLLGPPYFADPKVTVAVRRLVHARLLQTAPPPAPDIPLMRIFNVTISDLYCGSSAMRNTVPYLTMQQAQMAPFVGGMRFGSLPPTTVPTIAQAVTTMAEAQAALGRACSSDLMNNAVIEFVTEEGGSPNSAGAPLVATFPGDARSLRLGDMAKNGAQMRIMVAMFDAALGGGYNTHPQLYPRLRPASDPDIGKDICVAPCRFVFQDPTIRHVASTGVGPNVPVGDTGEDFIVYPTFEGVDLATVKKGGDQFSVLAGSGMSNLHNASAPGFTYGVRFKLTLTEVPDLAKSMGY